MCGRYALALRPAEVRQQLEDSDMPSQEAPEDDEVRQTYNFAPGYYGLVYRAETPDTGGGIRVQEQSNAQPEQDSQATDDGAPPSTQDSTGAKPAQYRLQAMKWGLVPFWTKRNPDYGSMMRTINCRDDSLMANGGMWHTMKQKKRCIVVAQGFYEWLKKHGGREKVPHYVKRKDGQLMCFAGLWDCVKYEDSNEKLYTYTIITTSSNQQLGFLHDRMPVILNNGSDDMFTWLDASKAEWSQELQFLLKPYTGELECYPVTRHVGKVGNNSPTFIVPINSSENKQNIANFFGNQGKPSESSQSTQKDSTQTTEPATQTTPPPSQTSQSQEAQNDGIDAGKSPAAGTKRAHADSPISSPDKTEKSSKAAKTATSPSASPSQPSKPTEGASGKAMRSATTNGVSPSKGSQGKTAAGKKAGEGSKKITSFFGS